MEPTVRTGLKYKHYSNLTPYGWNAVSRQAGTKNPDQARDNNPPSLLQQGQKYTIHVLSFVWGKRINWPFHSRINGNPRSHLAVKIFGTAGSGRGRHLLSDQRVGKESSKQKL
jgi:hypothetical protein